MERSIVGLLLRNLRRTKVELRSKVERRRTTVLGREWRSVSLTSNYVSNGALVWFFVRLKLTLVETVLTKELVIKDNKRPAQFQLSPEGYQLAERLATDAGIELHVYHPSSSNGHPSSSGLGGRQPSASGFNGTGPSSGGIVSSSFGGRGQTLGGQNSSIHAQTFRRRSPTPMDFLDLPTEDPEELELRQALKESLEMSRPGAGDPVANILRQTAARAAEGRMGGSGAASSSSAAFRPAGSTSSGINGRKAALGNIGASTSANQAPQGPSIANVGKPVQASSYSIAR